MTGRTAERLSLLVFVVGLGLSVYVFVVVQVLQSYPFQHLGAYGDQPFLFLTYTEVIEIALPASYFSFMLWEYLRSGAKSFVPGAIRAVGRSLAVFGGAAAAVVYCEIHLVWGELWYNVRVWPGLQGGGGYPWGDEQVAYNLCFVKASTYTQSTPNCYFLNYNWVLGVAMVAVLLGLVVELHFRSGAKAEPDPRSVPLTG